MKISATLLKNTEMLRAFANKEQILVNSYVLKKIKDEYGEIETEKAFYRYKDLMYKYGMYRLIDDSHDFEIIYNSFSETFEYEELFMFFYKMVKFNKKLSTPYQRKINMTL